MTRFEAHPMVLQRLLLLHRTGKLRRAGGLSDPYFQPFLGRCLTCLGVRHPSRLRAVQDSGRRVGPNWDWSAEVTSRFARATAPGVSDCRLGASTVIQ